MLQYITESERLLKLATMVLGDSFPTMPEKFPTYLFTETADNQSSVLVRGAELLKIGTAAKLLLLDDKHGGNKGYPGATAWRRHLRAANVPLRCTEFIPSEEPLNTFSEAKALVRYAKQERWRRIIIIAPPFHQLRAFMSVVSALAHINSTGLLVYNCAGVAPMSWYEEVAHSQGTLRAERCDLIVEELRRIRKYQQKGDLIPDGEVLQYLFWRRKEFS